MRKILIFFAAVVLAASCNSARKSESISPELYAQLSETAEELDYSCPVSFGPLTQECVEFDGQFFVYTYTVDESELSMSVLKAGLETTAKQVRETFDTPVTKEFMDLCREADVQILYKYIGEYSGEMCQITYDPRTKKTKIKTGLKAAGF